jgi:UDP-4-amino-4,6-dideoxy-N-acetyl-beta-L-altrosamine N-acetyltransferase
MASREDFLLRPMAETDLSLVLEWRNSDRVRANMYTDDIIPLESHLNWFSGAKSDPKARYFVLEHKGTPVGVVNVVQIDQRNRKCYWGFYLGATDAPKQSGPAMEFLALEYMFDTLKMHKVCCEVFTFNDAVVKLHKKFGFTEEGVLVDHILKNDKYEDAVAMAIFKDAWDSLKATLEKICFRG